MNNHSLHETLIESNIFDTCDPYTTMERIQTIYSSEHGPYDGGSVGFYISEHGRKRVCDLTGWAEKNISKPDKRDISYMIFCLSDIPDCDGQNSEYKNHVCDPLECLNDSEMSEYSLCNNSSTCISSERQLRHSCNYVDIFPVNAYKQKYYHRKFIKFRPSNIKEELLSKSGKIFENIIFGENFFNNNVFDAPRDRMEICKVIFKHLCVLDDLDYEEWVSNNASGNLIDLYKAKYDITMSPESPNGHDNKKYMRRRDFVFLVNGENFACTCEWHTKFGHVRNEGYDEGRIYFYVPTYPDILENNHLKGKVLIGKICGHL